MQTKASLLAKNEFNFIDNKNNDCSPIINQITAMSNDQFKAMQNKMMPQLLTDTGKLKQVVYWSETSDRKTFKRMYCDFSNSDLRGKKANYLPKFNFSGSQFFKKQTPP